jgi:hypothetical protein
MKPQTRSPKEKGFPNYSRVPVNTLKKSRKGKHHDLIVGIMEDLRAVERGFAVKIPLASTDNVSALKLRAAITRAAAKEKIQIATSADDENFYVWKV